MNKDNLRSIIANYMENFEMINNEQCREYYKWEAVKHFRDNWDIDAPDFAGMFKESVRKTWILINNRIVQPTNGIVKLAERAEARETVREMFRKLYADDGGDIKARQNRIYDFLAEADELLDKYEKGRWKYAQDMRTVIFYLALMYPEQNYMFKATQARAFMNCVQYGDDFGAGQYFSLEKYYRMCDELTEEIKNNTELMKLHNDRLTADMYSEDDYHILAYDIIYCAVVYSMYSNIEIPKKEKKKAKKSESNRIDVSPLREELAQKREELSALLSERSEYDGFSAKGLFVKHRVFGNGIVFDHEGSSVRVRFAKCEKKFMLPQGFTDGFLKTESEEATDIFIKIDELDRKIKEAELEIKVLEMQIGNN